MAQTDRQTDRSSRWAFTAYEDQWSLFESIPPGIAEWGWNAEICPNTNRRHYQGYIRLQQQQRFAWLRKLLPGVHIEVSKNWDALKLYCQKEETRIPGTQPIQQVSSYMTIYQYADDVAKRIADLIKASGQTINQIPKEKRLEYVDTLVREDICEGKRYVAHIATNPQWVTMWRKYSFELFFSYYNIENAKEESRSEEGEKVPGKGTELKPSGPDNESR